MAFKKSYSIQLHDHRTGEIIQATGGKAYVAIAGRSAKETLYDMAGATPSWSSIPAPDASTTPLRRPPPRKADSDSVPMRRWRDGTR